MLKTGQISQPGCHNPFKLDSARIYISKAAAICTCTFRNTKQSLFNKRNILSPATPQTAVAIHGLLY